SSYWATGRSLAVVERSIAHSLCVGAYCAAEQIGFARVATDRAVFAYLMDVFVVPEYRGRGIGKALVRAVVAHPDLQGLRLFALRTGAAPGLYASFGFTGLPAREDFMFIEKPRACPPSSSTGRVTRGARRCRIGRRHHCPLARSWAAASA